MATRYLNQLDAACVCRVSVRPQGDVPVIAWLVTGSGEAWIPARAIRWTPVAVMVVWVDREINGPRRDGLAWLPAGDVARTLTPPTPAAWATAHPA